MSINSCLATVGSLDGMAVTTVEGIGNSEVGLHGVQSAPAFPCPWNLAPSRRRCWPWCWPCCLTPALVSIWAWNGSQPRPDFALGSILQPCR